MTICHPSGTPMPIGFRERIKKPRRVELTTWWVLMTSLE